MKTPPPSRLTALIVLLVLVVTIAAIPASPISALVSALLIALLAAEIDRTGRHLALKIIAAACRLVPQQRRADYEWPDPLDSVRLV